jgi:hypothetical protein
MTKEVKRVFKQLFFTSNEYFNMSKSLIKSINIEIYKNIFKDFTYKELMKKNVMMFNAHLASCAIRLCSIDEKIFNILKIKSCRMNLYNEKRKDIKNISKDYIIQKNIFHFVLRNGIAHFEPDINGTSWESNLEKILNEFSMDDMFIEMKKIILEIKKELKTFKAI